MTIDSEFLDMMVDTIRLRRYMGLDKYSKHTYSPIDINIQCRIVYKTSQIYNITNIRVQSKATINCYGNNNISYNDQILLPGDDPTSNNTLIVKIDRFPDEDGAYYEQVFVS